MANLGRRRNNRVSLSSPIQVSWLDIRGIPHCHQAMTIDISDNGIRFVLPEAPDDAVPVQMRAHNLGLTCTGNVRACSRSGEKFIVGVEFSGTARFNRISAGMEHPSPRGTRL